MVSLDSGEFYKKNEELKLEEIPSVASEKDVIAPSKKHKEITEFVWTIYPKNIDYQKFLIECSEINKAGFSRNKLDQMSLTQLRKSLFDIWVNGRFLTIKSLKELVSEILKKIKQKVANKKFD
ncbi:hypothetical protein KY343_05505 [Candidatus Woesearchaeota archaeon]|nr:hypothetical protein [Candidatus Woesearchaeota archaeon]